MLFFRRKKNEPAATGMAAAHNASAETPKITCDNRGFTLTELLVSVVILSIIVFPTMQALIASTKMNNEARKKLQATVTADSVLESAKAFSIHEYYKQCNDLKTFVVLANMDSTKKMGQYVFGSDDPNNLAYEAVIGVNGASLPFDDTANHYAFYINGIKQSKGMYDAVIVFEKRDYQDVAVGTTQINEAQVNSRYRSSDGIMNYKYDITVYIYPHDKSKPNNTHLKSGHIQTTGYLAKTKGSKLDTGLQTF